MTLYTNHPLEREAVKQHATVREVLRATGLAWIRMFGGLPTRNQLGLKTAHWAFETGWFRVGLWCWNLNNEKTKSDRHPHCYFRCGETEDGVTVYYDPPHLQTCFKAFRTLEEGVAAAIAFLALDTTPNNGRPNRYQAAWDALVREDVVAFVVELERAGFFTADPGHYLRGVEWCLNEILASGAVDEVLAELEGEVYITPTDPVLPPDDQEHSPANDEDIAISWAELTVPWAELQADKLNHYTELNDLWK